MLFMPDISIVKYGNGNRFTHRRSFYCIECRVGRAGTEHAFHQRADLRRGQSGMLGPKNLFQILILIVTG